MNGVAIFPSSNLTNQCYASLREHHRHCVAGHIALIHLIHIAEGLSAYRQFLATGSICNFVN